MLYNSKHEMKAKRDMKSTLLSLSASAALLAMATTANAFPHSQVDAGQATQGSIILAQGSGGAGSGSGTDGGSGGASSWPGTGTPPPGGTVQDANPVTPPDGTAGTGTGAGTGAGTATSPGTGTGTGTAGAPVPGGQQPHTQGAGSQEQTGSTVR